MQQIVAVLAPTLADVTPAQRDRAHRATMEQMMLLARGLPVDSVPVRCAAAMVGSAVAPDFLEYELAPVEWDEPASSSQRTAALQIPRETDPAWKRSEGYARHLRTIMSIQPV